VAFSKNAVLCPSYFFGANFILFFLKLAKKVLAEED